MLFEVGQEIRLEPKRFYVYALLDDQGVCFYIGITCDPVSRLRQHMSTSAAPRVKDRISAVSDKRMLILSEPLPEVDARELEAELIAINPGLANQEHHPCRKPQGRHPAIEKFLRSASNP